MVRALVIEPKRDAGEATLQWVNRAGRDGQRGHLIAWAEICPTCGHPSHRIEAQESVIEACLCEGNMMRDLRELDERSPVALSYSRELARRHGLELEFGADVAIQQQSAAYRG